MWQAKMCVKLIEEVTLREALLLRFGMRSRQPREFPASFSNAINLSSINEARNDASICVDRAVRVVHVRHGFGDGPSQ